jgi:hypothetical protein
MELPRRTDDNAIAMQALAFGLAPVPLSQWYTQPPRRAGRPAVGRVTHLAESAWKRIAHAWSS